MLDCLKPCQYGTMSRRANYGAAGWPTAAPAMLPLLLRRRLGCSHLLPAPHCRIAYPASWALSDHPPPPSPIRELLTPPSLPQIICLTASVILAYFVCSDGTSNWLMGLQLIATYCLVAFIYALKKEPLPPVPVPSPSPVPSPFPPPSPHGW